MSYERTICFPAGKQRFEQTDLHCSVAVSKVTDTTMSFAIVIYCNYLIPGCVSVFCATNRYHLVCSGVFRCSGVLGCVPMFWCVPVCSDVPVFQRSSLTVSQYS